MNISFDITDPDLIAGIEYARDLYNSTLPLDQPDLSSEDYLRFVAVRSVASYAEQRELHERRVAAGLDEPIRARVFPDEPQEDDPVE